MMQDYNSGQQAINSKNILLVQPVEDRANCSGPPFPVRP